MHWAVWGDSVNVGGYYFRAVLSGNWGSPPLTPNILIKGSCLLGLSIPRLSWSHGKEAMDKNPWLFTPVSCQWPHHLQATPPAPRTDESGSWMPWAVQSGFLRLSSQTLMRGSFAPTCVRKIGRVRHAQVLSDKLVAFVHGGMIVLFLPCSCLL